MKNSFLLKQLAWAFYLASSWTWCIGMFLPVILQKDFGHGAWLAFLVFNIIGATGFIFFIKDKNKSKTFVSKNKVALSVFSIVTILFQLFFIGWVTSSFGLMGKIIMPIIMIGLMLTVNRIAISSVGIIVWLLSFMIAISYVLIRENNYFIEQFINQLIAVDERALYALPLLALGFLLCPYLDLTFHYVVQEDEHNHYHGNRLSFLIGFPLLFGILMLFSLMYVDTANHLLLYPKQSISEQLPIIRLLFFYFIIQAGFTVFAHWNRVRLSINKTWKTNCFFMAVAVIILPLYLTPDINEIIYRCFLAFYAIIAPAYVWTTACSDQPVSSKMLAPGVGIALLLSSVPMFLMLPEYYYLYGCAALVVLVIPWAAKMLVIKQPK